MCTFLQMKDLETQSRVWFYTSLSKLEFNSLKTISCSKRTVMFWNY